MHLWKGNIWWNVLVLIFVRKVGIKWHLGLLHCTHCTFVQHAKCPLDEPYEVAECRLWSGLNPQHMLFLLLQPQSEPTFGKCLRLTRVVWVMASARYKRYNLSDVLPTWPYLLLLCWMHMDTWLNPDFNRNERCTIQDGDILSAFSFAYYS